jgi:hypothetical protein
VDRRPPGESGPPARASAARGTPPAQIWAAAARSGRSAPRPSARQCCPPPHRSCGPAGFPSAPRNGLDQIDIQIWHGSAQLGIHCGIKNNWRAAFSPPASSPTRW